MNRIVAMAFVVVLSVTLLAAAPTALSPDFWYVVSNGTSASAVGESVRGIVVPSSVTPTVQTTPAGSVISWRRPDGTRQSFAVQGVSSITFQPGPLKGTTYVPFSRARRISISWPDESCCSCATWLNSVESLEAMSCVAGCAGCVCEGCICSPTLPCPTRPPDGLTLVAHNGAAPILSFEKSNEGDRLSVTGQDGSVVKFRGARLSAEVVEGGETVINNPDAIAMPGRIATSTTVRGDKALFAWVSPGASVILEQPRAMPAPEFEKGQIAFDRQPVDGQAMFAKRLSIDPVMDRCRACGTHPNSKADLDIYDCVPGDSVCYRCVSWECFAPQS